MQLKELKELWLSDLHRYEESMQVNMKKVFYRQFQFAGFHYMFWLRLCKYLSTKGKICFPFYAFSMLVLQHYKYKYGISISPKTGIEKGLYIGHYGGIVVNSGAKIGNNCVIMQGVTIGASNRGKKKGVPTIGDNVYMGTGCVIIGSVKIGNNVAIGANSVVTTDVPDNAVVAGMPAEIKSFNGSDGYIGFPYPIKSLKSS
ncbi:serine O-acetyltransferase [Paenibacillus sp. UNC451MF]|uniref:serine O-acetyltransferase n=1 Tax=Paenibacillus sp. UNC451MF TaxID=1449063 RepID=UPI00056A5D5B|nr:serine O-acetyltransferase [Paenibacillus sp. UNC451MF]